MSRFWNPAISFCGIDGCPGGRVIFCSRRIKKIMAGDNDSVVSFGGILSDEYVGFESWPETQVRS